MKKPYLFINLKAYKEGTGKNAERLASIAGSVSSKHKARIFVCAQATDIYRITQETSATVFGQHMDLAGQGANTGRITPEALRSAGARGVVLNHAEYKIEPRILKKTVALAKDKRLKTLVCADTLDEARKVARMGPDFVALEPPKLIGGNISVSTSDPSIIEKAVKAVKNIDPNIKLLVGAGIKSPYDVKESLDLGADGVFVASGIVKSRKPGNLMESMVIL